MLNMRGKNKKTFVFVLIMSMLLSSTLTTFNVQDAKVFANQLIETIEETIETIVEEETTEEITEETTIDETTEEDNIEESEVEETETEENTSVETIKEKEESKESEVVEEETSNTGTESTEEEIDETEETETKETETKESEKETESSETETSETYVTVEETETGGTIEPITNIEETENAETEKLLEEEEKKEKEEIIIEVEEPPPEEEETKKIDEDEWGHKLDENGDIVEPIAIEEPPPEYEDIPEEDAWGHKLDRNGDIVEPISHEAEEEDTGYYYPEEPEEEPPDGKPPDEEIEEAKPPDEIDFSLEKVKGDYEDVPEELENDDSVENLPTNTVNSSVEPESESESNDEVNIEEIETETEVETESESETETTEETYEVEIDYTEASETETETIETETEEIIATDSEIAEEDVLDLGLEFIEATTSNMMFFGAEPDEATISELPDLELETIEVPEFAKTIGYCQIRFKNAAGKVVKYLPGPGSSDWYLTHDYQETSDPFPNTSIAGTKTGYTRGTQWVGPSTVAQGRKWYTPCVSGDKIYTFSAKFTENSYKVTYYLQNDKFEGISYKSGYTPPTSRLYTKTATYPTDANINHVGWDFGGWFANSDYTGSATKSVGPNSTASPVVYAKWSVSPGYHEVIFDSNGGSVVKTQSVKDGAAATKPANPTKTGTKDFKGWFVPDGAGGWNPFDFTTPITEKITLKAFYDVYPDHDVTLNYWVDGEKILSVPCGVIRTDGVNLSLEEFKEDKKGHNFLGWKYNGNLYKGGQTHNIAVGGDYEADFVATFEKEEYDVNYHIDKYYGVYFAGTEGSLEAIEHRHFDEETKLYGSEKIDFEENWKYIGWYDNESYRGSTKTVVPKGTYDDSDFYVRFVPGNGYHLVTFDSNGGSWVPYQSIKHGKRLDAIIEPIRGNDIFLGWYQDTGYRNYERYDENTIIENNVTLIALWNDIPDPLPRPTDGHQKWIDGLVEEEEYILEIRGKNLEGFSKIKYDEKEDKFYREKADDITVGFGFADTKDLHLKYLLANEWVGVVFNDKSNRKVRWYYIDENKEFATGFKYIDGYLYYFGGDNEMFTGDLVQGTMVYHFSDKDDDTIGRYLGAESLYNQKRKEKK